MESYLIVLLLMPVVPKSYGAGDLLGLYRSDDLDSCDTPSLMTK